MSKSTNFSDVFTTTQSDLLIHNGKSFEIIEEINAADYDFDEVGKMYKILLSTGEILEVFEDEITVF